LFRNFGFNVNAEPFEFQTGVWERFFDEQKNDEGELKGIVEKIISENPEVVATYKGGKENAIMSLVGKIIKETNGSANPQVVIKLLKELIK
jgi:aspartyl-tRNA(Asn)/glutamyl-tRNA(Gln) amidotransferase subunit B